ncbi:MAG: NAD(P)-dependent alcohol dehydrogenase, partial [Ornithinimicrobium sp.]
AEPVRALRFHTYGAPEVLHVEEVPEPRAPQGDELLVQVAASSINGTDLGLRRGDLKIATVGRMPFVPGFDISGRVLACGPAVTAFSTGDRVVALQSHGGGGQGERILLRQHRAAIAPTRPWLTTAAALPLAGLTALQALRGQARLHTRGEGARVLVIGASGGIGAYGVQLARLHGAHVTALSSTSHLGWVKDLGAQEVLDRNCTPLSALAEGGDRFDVVLDAHGGADWAVLRRLLRKSGSAVSTRPISRDAILGILARRIPGPDDVLSGRRQMASVRTAPRSQDLTHLAALVDREQLQIPLDRIYDLADAAAAHHHAETQAHGKVVISIKS